MILEVAILIASLIILAKSSDMVTDKAIILSDYFGISRMAIGFLLLSVSTSLPEFSVAVASSVTGHGALSAGNVFGANIADILLILGVCAIASGLVLKRADASEIGAVLLVSSTITAYFIYSAFVLGVPVIDRLEGALLLLAFMVYVYYITVAKKFPKLDGRQVSKKEALSAFLIFFLAVGGVIVGAGLAVDSAVNISELFGISRSFLGATLVSMGTTLPELSVSLSAARKKEYSLAFGNAVGSTVINLTLVLGFAALINPIQIVAPQSFLVTLIFSVIANVVLLYLAIGTKKLGKIWGILLIALYIVFLLVLYRTEVFNGLPPVLP
ncbi:MAG: sodium:calcium antiporter [Candidatus Micrarchaeota archaeon]|nr:sodium:calcium antiporter [Candidatus Micrarchaeota archaeon]